MAQFQLTQLIVCSVCLSKKIYPSFLRVGDFSIFICFMQRKCIPKVAPNLDIAGIMAIAGISPEVQGEVEWDCKTFS